MSISSCWWPTCPPSTGTPGPADSGCRSPYAPGSGGGIRERRFTARSGLEVEFGIGAPSWAATQPVDPGTRRVVGDGALVLYDPVGLLAELKDACRGG
ncbi:hypothetical protein ABZ820_26400 [Streptomyces diacarni]|uniref:hypothetical protein n=1 Tax=Streptomyces diacarni TaxID=2800381 RepID=UPI0033C7FB87